MDCARLNCSHGDADALARRAADVRAVAERCGRPLGLLFDLQGPKLRLSGDTAEQVMRRDDRITFAEHDPGPGRVLVDFEGFSRLVTDRSQIVIGDGVPRFAVEAIRDGGPSPSSAPRRTSRSSRSGSGTSGRRRARSPRSRRSRPTSGSTRSSGSPTG
jgi:pyruvate kinase